MLSDLPRVTQQGLEFEPMGSDLGLFSPFTFAAWAEVLKDGYFDWPNIMGRKGKESSVGRME